MNYSNGPIETNMAQMGSCADIPIKLALEGINKQLAEADAILGQIMCNILGAPGPDEMRGSAPNGMNEQVAQIDCMASRILSESHRLQELLFGEARL